MTTQHTVESLLDLVAEFGAAAVNHYLANENDREKWQKAFDANATLTTALTEVMAELAEAKAKQWDDADKQEAMNVVEQQAREIEILTAEREAYAGAMDRMKAKIKALESQEPVAYGMGDTMLGRGNRLMMVRLDKGQDGCTVPLYLAPGAAPKENT